MAQQHTLGYSVPYNAVADDYIVKRMNGDKEI